MERNCLAVHTKRNKRLSGMWKTFGWCKECETNSMKENFLYRRSENKKLIEYDTLNLTCDSLQKKSIRVFFSCFFRERLIFTELIALCYELSNCLYFP